MEYPEVALPNGTRAFAMQGRNTSLLSDLPAGATRRFVFFPLPSGDPESQQYLKTVESKLPPGQIRVVRVDGIDFVTGPVSCLAPLFPRIASAVAHERCVCGVPVKENRVYNRAHSDGE
jgi:hypothetical protein